ncbi:MAG: hypothetical protein CML68_16155 [Rhodobacteraceae bacterium]|nr:hypothetical protein [Paracoccaceae bacterium]
MSDFWARRKAAVAAETHAERHAIEARAIAADAQCLDLVDAGPGETLCGSLDETPEAEQALLDSLGLPDPDHCDDSAVIRRILSETLPRQLRRRTLRRLWRLDPVLANLDGLVDYDEDFTDAAMVPDHVGTTYQVGRGLARHVEDLARQAQSASGAEDDGPSGDDIAPTASGDLPAKADLACAEACDGPDTEPPEASVTADADPDPVPRPGLRRIRVTFDTPVQTSGDTA